MTKAGFLVRFVAILIDALLVCAVGWFARASLLGLAIFLAYESVLVAFWNGQTVGKKIMGIKVVTLSGGTPDGMKAFIRALSKILSAIPLDLGFLWALWDGKSQTWHDKIAETYVVKA